MTIRTSYIRPEDDPSSWFNRSGQEGVEGPAVITAISDGPWSLTNESVRHEFTSSSLKFDRLFVPPGWRLRGPNLALISGYIVRGTAD